MPSILLKSPAKLNLFLKVLHKRPDGYHELATIFERVSLCDDIRMTSNQTGRIRILCDHPQVPKGPKNLVYKVAQLMQKEFGVKQGVVFRIKKRIPVAAGMAGGSSNAATTLLGLNQIWGLGLSLKQLVHLGAQIGSDVPFFLYKTSWALGTGRGEQIAPVKTKAQFWHVVVTPKLKMYSRDVFGRLNLELTNQGPNVNIFTLALKKGEPVKLGQLLHNDLETSILRIRPELLRVKARLQEYSFCGVAFSGSGPSCYGLSNSEKSARMAAKKLQRIYAGVFVVRTL